MGKIELGWEWDGNGEPPAVRVHWDDTQSYPKWKSVKKAFELEAGHVVTVGFLLEWTERVVRVSGSYTTDGGLVDAVGNTDVIPTGWVRLVEALQ